MYHKSSTILLITLLLLGLLNIPWNVSAQEQQPPTALPEETSSSKKTTPPGSPHRPHRPFPDAGLFDQQAANLVPQATGGPDGFGYTWDDAISFDWFDAAAGGTNAGLVGDDEFSGPVDIGFPFRFYGNTYSELYISTNGLVTFGEGSWDWTNSKIPSLGTPNNFIAPFWDDLGVSWGGYNTGSIYYMRGGTITNQFFVVEWNQVSRRESTTLLTFEVIIYESGDILMQYQSHSETQASAAVGIENDAGYDGLEYPDDDPGLGSDQAILFSRPIPSARVDVWPLYQGVFTHIGETAAFEIPIHNTGDLGPDVFNLSSSSLWPVLLYGSDGITLLKDTDYDGIVDTGSVEPGSAFTAIAKIKTPGLVEVGDQNIAAITVRSSINDLISKTVSLSTAVPAPFAQAYMDAADGAMSLNLVQPTQQITRKVTGDDSYRLDLAVERAPNGTTIYGWTNLRYLDSRDVDVSDIEYALVNQKGEVTRPVSKLTDYSGALMDTWDYTPAFAASPDGNIGVIWVHEMRDNLGQYNDNVFFAILNKSGNLAYGPVNLTNNTMWGVWDEYGIPYGFPWFWSPRISATGDNRFVLAWEKYTEEPGGFLNDIYYTVRDTHNNPILGVTEFPDDGPEYEPALTKLKDHRVMLAWSNTNTNAYVILNSNGSIVKPAALLNQGGGNIDAVQLSNGNVMLAWTAWGMDGPQITYAVVDGSTYNLAANPSSLVNPAALTGDNYVSVTADTEGHAILTWMDYDYDYRTHLYYALMDGDGTVLTEPMIFRTAAPFEWGSYIETSFEGFGSVPYSDSAVYLPVLVRSQR